MNKPNAEEIRTRLERSHERVREEMRREEEAMDAFAVHAVQALTEGLAIGVGDSTATTKEAPIDTEALVEEDARRAIEARRLQPATVAPDPRPGEPPLLAVLRGIVEDYAEPLTPSDETVRALEGLRGIALDKADTYGLWADLQLEAALAVRAEMPDVIDIVTARAESVIIAELLAAEARLATDYPDAPLPHTGNTAGAEK